MKISSLLRLSLAVSALGVAMAAQAVSINLVSSGSYVFVNSDTVGNNFSVDELVLIDTAASLPMLDKLHLDFNDGTGTGPATGEGFYVNNAGTDGFKFSFSLVGFTVGTGVSSTHGAWTLTSASGAFAGYAGSGTLSASYDFSTNASYTTLVGNLNAVPEPASMAVLGIGACALLRRRAKK